jgi:hypothetical protein
MDNSITANRNELIDKLQTNLAEHQAKVEKAQKNYRQKVMEELERRLADGRNGRPLDVSIFASMPVPRSFAREYEQAIEELRWHTEETIELSSRDFKRFVLDNWDWAPQFAASNSAYLVE